MCASLYVTGGPAAEHGDVAIAKFFKLEQRCIMWFILWLLLLMFEEMSPATDTCWQAR
jgi:hypothetical protein